MQYHQAIKSGVSHSAGAQEKKRRKAALRRKSGVVERREEFKKADLAWHEEFDSKPVKEEEFEDETAGGMETEAVAAIDDNTFRVHSGRAKQVSASTIKPEERGKLFESAKKYRRLTQDEVEKFKTETKGDELNVMRRRRVNIFAQRVRKMDKQKKDKRRLRIKAARQRKRREESEAFYISTIRRMLCAVRSSSRAFATKEEAVP